MKIADSFRSLLSNEARHEGARIRGFLLPR